MLKITTHTPIIKYLKGQVKYYIVYENGAVKKTSEFVPADVISYGFFPRDKMENSIALHLIDVTTPEGEKLNKIANNILLLTEEPKLKIIAVTALFVLGGRYFFNVLCDKAINGYKLFEYIPAENSIKEIASLNHTIDHVEMLESYEQNHSTVQNAEAVYFEDLDMVLGEKRTIKPQFTPDTIKATKTDIDYTYDDGTVVGIDKYGEILAIAPGTVTVTGTTKYGLSASFTVTITDPDFKQPRDLLKQQQ